MQPLSGKVAIVTGGSKGMGRHFVRTLVAAGARVACLARPSPALDAVAAEHGDSVAAIGCDIADAAQVAAAIAETVARFGRLDILVNNAGIFHPFLIAEASDAQVPTHVGLNLLGVIWTIRAAIPHLRAAQGHIVNISSESVRHPFPMLTVYAATKAAVEALSAGLVSELRADNIRVSVLRSGSVAGGSGGLDWPDGAAEKFFRKISETGHAAMAGKAATPESMAAGLLAIVTLPRDVNVELVELRAARAGVPEGVSKMGN